MRQVTSVFPARVAASSAIRVVRRLAGVTSLGLALTVAGASCSRASTASGGGGAIRITASGEALSLEGYPFPPASPDDVAFVDGWEVRFDEVLVTLGNVTIAENPDRSPTDQAQTEGVVATANGPWALDLHRGGPLAGKGGSGEQAVLLTELLSQNQNGDRAFDPTKRYAVGFDIVPATSFAKRLAIDPAAAADYEDMIAKGITVLYVGTATFKGTDCTPASDPVLDALPKVVTFRLGFKAPTTFTNCQNPDNDPASAFSGEEHQRGLLVKANTQSVAQLTLHTDHAFWESFEHDSPPHFDQLAAQAKPGAGGAPATLTFDDLVGVDPSTFSNKGGQPLPWRSCVGTDVYTRPTTTPMGFDTKGVPVNPGGPPETSIRDYRDFITYLASTQGHLNADGLCSVKRNYASPP